MKNKQMSEGFKYFLLYVVLHVSIIIFTSCVSRIAKADFLCDDEAGKLTGNVYHACGLAENADESAARVQALVNAQEEFHTFCMYSSNCIRHFIYLDPKRTFCKEIVKNGKEIYKCTRLVDFTVKDMWKHKDTWVVSHDD